MGFLIDPYIKKNTEDLSFINLKENAQLNIKGYSIPNGGLDVPLLTDELAENIKNKKENEIITIAAILRGMAYTLGIDENFKYRDEYLKFLRAADENIENFILFNGVNSVENNKLIEGIIYFKSVLVMNEVNTQALLSYGVTLLKYCASLPNKKMVKVFKKEAKNKLEELLMIQQEPMALYQLAHIYKDEMQFKKAQLYGEKLLKLEIDELFQTRVKHLLLELRDLVQYETGYEAILEGQTEVGLPLLVELEENYSEWWNLIFFIGLGYRQLGEFDEAISRFQKVLSLKEDLIDALVELGLCYGGVGNYLEASEYFLRAIELGGENSEILCNLAMSYMEMGNLQDARMYINKSLEMDPNDEITLICQKRIDELVGSST